MDILEQQFGYSRDALQEMLELHEGNLEIALDMLAQLEAEKDGQLPASGQVHVKAILALSCHNPQWGSRTAASFCALEITSCCCMCALASASIREKRTWYLTFLNYINSNFCSQMLRLRV